ncbi:hypothetical protein DCC62_24550 [candidate division KSB1 bacterium]|nr:MAG: hypothetical protein DCC62_24550 [candidate division KSB1 bacterium]
MYELKTKLNDRSVTAFVNSLPDEQKRRDSLVIIKLMQEATKMKPKMWGSSIIGFGSYHYTYASGHEGDMCLIGFSPRKQYLALYLWDSAPDAELLKKLGKHKTSKACLYINRLSDIHLPTLKKLIQHFYKQTVKTKT